MPARSSAPLVVKIGGSLAASSAVLVPLLQELTQAAERGAAVVVVPGGGPFADAVRAAQQALGFDDTLAHDLALLAMAQYGRVLAALAPLVPAPGLASVRAAAAAGACVWLPQPRSDALAVPRSWRISADSLALWLAGQIGAAHVVLVKACAAVAPAELASLADQGIIDPAYPELAASAPHLATTLVFDGSAVALRSALAAHI